MVEERRRWDADPLTRLLPTKDAQATPPGLGVFVDRRFKRRDCWRRTSQGTTMANTYRFGFFAHIIVALVAFGGLVVTASRAAAAWMSDAWRIAWPSPLAANGFTPRVAIAVPVSERQRVIDYMNRRAAHIERPTFAAGTGCRLAA